MKNSNKLSQKIDLAWERNEKALQKEHSPQCRSFLYGYKMAINEISGWIEIEQENKKSNLPHTSTVHKDSFHSA